MIVILWLSTAILYKIRYYIREACKSDKLIQIYLLGVNSTTYIDKKKLKIENNHKARRVMELLLRHKNVKKVNVKPLTLQYFKDSIS